MIGPGFAYSKEIIASSSHPKPVADDLGFFHSQAASPWGVRARLGVGAFTLVETMVALAVFVIGGIACTETMGILNRSAAASRAAVAAQTLLSSKINKLITVNYDTRDNLIPAACDPTTTPPAGTYVFNGIDVGGLETFNSLATDGYSADTSDFWSAVAGGSATPPTGTSVTLVSDSTNRAIVTGTIYRRVSVFEAYTRTVEVTYSIVYAISGRNFVAQLSLVRSPDVQ